MKFLYLIPCFVVMTASNRLNEPLMSCFIDPLGIYKAPLPDILTCKCRLPFAIYIAPPALLNSVFGSSQFFPWRAGEGACFNRPLFLIHFPNALLGTAQTQRYITLLPYTNMLITQDSTSIIRGLQFGQVGTFPLGEIRALDLNARLSRTRRAIRRTLMPEKSLQGSGCGRSSSWTRNISGDCHGRLSDR